jgi:hypothetical protein
MDTEKKPNKLLFLIPMECCVVLILAVLLLSGCQTSSVDALNVGSPQALTLPASTPVETTSTATIESATLPPPNATPPPVPSSTSAATNGFYPVIGRARTGAAAQLSKSDTDNIRDELRQASEKSSQSSTTKSAVEYESDITELRKKAATHGKSALEKIENSSE